jgi:hypothetical protein
MSERLGVCGVSASARETLTKTSMDAKHSAIAFDVLRGRSWSSKNLGDIATIHF